MKLHPAQLAVLAAAALFGASTPLARALVGTLDPMWLAGLLYAGSGVGLGVVLAWRRVRDGRPAAPFAPRDLALLAATVAIGGVVAPLLLTFGLATTGGAAASLLLNLETVLTVGIAWFVFGEHRNARVVIGMALIVVACVLTSGEGGGDTRFNAGALLIALACLGWAIDNNLTRKISGNDATVIATAKGLVGGAVNVGLALAIGGAPPPLAASLAAALVGLLGYGVSLVLFVIALRNLGVARASAYFGIAPFIGVAVAFALLGERPGAAFWLALPLMALGVWLHLTELHGHLHAHEWLDHTHPHHHDEHHRHEHEFAWDGSEPHAHRHVHAPLTHAHPHFPDLHHRHPH